MVPEQKSSLFWELSTASTQLSSVIGQSSPELYHKIQFPKAQKVGASGHERLDGTIEPNKHENA